MYKVNIKILLILLLITSIGGFLRFYQLDKYPVQLNHDEMSQLYETISIAKTGKDIYGNRLPVVFPLFGVYAPGHYIYLTTIFYKIFGGEEIIIRLPAAIMGTLTIFSVYLFANILLNNWKIASFAAFLIAIMPSEIFYSRKSFEYMTGHFLVFLGLSFLLLYIRKKNQKFWAIAGVISLAIAMYTYAAHTTAVPFFILLFLVIFKYSLKEIKKFLLPIFIFALFVLPLLYLIFTNPDLRFRAGTIFITQDINFSKLIPNSELGNNISSGISYIKTFVDYSFNRYLYQFNPIYLFENGLDFTNQGDIGMGPLYYFQLPLLILGFIFLIRQRVLLKEKSFLFGLIVLSMIPGSLTFESHSPHRSVNSFTLLSIVSAVGIYWLFLLINSFLSEKKILKYLLFGSISIVIIVNFIYFIHMYTVNFTYEKSQQMHYPYKDVSLYAWSQYSNYDYIIVDPIYGQSAPVKAVAVHYYLAYYGNYPPDKFQKDLKINRMGMSFDKFSVREIDWRKDQSLVKTLIIASPWSIPIDSIEKNKIIKRFNFYDGQLAFYAIKL